MNDFSSIFPMRISNAGLNIIKQFSAAAWRVSCVGTPDGSRASMLRRCACLDCSSPPLCSQVRMGAPDGMRRAGRIHGVPCRACLGCCRCTFPKIDDPGLRTRDCRSYGKRFARVGSGRRAFHTKNGEPSLAFRPSPGCHNSHDSDNQSSSSTRSHRTLGISRKTAQAGHVCLSWHKHSNYLTA